MSDIQAVRRTYQVKAMVQGVHEELRLVFKATTAMKAIDRVVEWATTEGFTLTSAWSWSDDDSHDYAHRVYNLPKGE